LQNKRVQAMEYTIELLEKERNRIEKYVRVHNLMEKDIGKASKELTRVSELKRAIKILKLKSRKE